MALNFRNLGALTAERDISRYSREIGASYSIIQDAIKFIADQNNVEIVSLIGEDTSKVLCDYLHLTLWVA